MPIAKFMPRPEEEILYRTTPNRKWYVYAWKIISGILGITVLIFIIYSLFAGPTERVVSSILPPGAARVLVNIFYLGLLPLAALAWVLEEAVSTYIGEFILSNQRIWVHGSPYYWSQTETPLSDIASLTWRRDAMFLKQKSARKIQVHMFSEGKQFVKAYEQFMEKTKMPEV
jgi:hypothetical protein